MTLLHPAKLAKQSTCQPLPVEVNCKINFVVFKQPVHGCKLSRRDLRPAKVLLRYPRCAGMYV
eukprot:350318-Chlamydomonas_euryale.AAC.10